MSSQEAILQSIRARAMRDGLPFESPTRGAVVLSRLRLRPPPSEVVRGVSEVGIVKGIIRKTLLHPHRVRVTSDQFTGLPLVVFWRHVTEGDQRWDFEVDVSVDRAGAPAIEDVRVIHPGDDIADPDDPDADPVEPRDPIAEADLMPAGMVACPCCGHATLSERGAYQICPVCFWEDDGQDTPDADIERGGPNRVSLTRARASYVAFGASVEQDREHVRAPTREEVLLRRFTSEGREA